MKVLDTYFSQLTDSCRGQAKQYGMAHIITFSILAVMSGATSYRQIRQFIATHRERLNDLFGLEWRQAPVHSTIREIIHKVDESELEEAFRRHGQSLITDDQNGKKEITVALDGKTLKGSFDHFQDRKAAHILSAFATEEKIILGRIQVEDKSNEIPAVQRMIKELGIPEAVFTVDAMHCQKNRSKSPHTREFNRIEQPWVHINLTGDYIWRLDHEPAIGNLRKLSFR